jgi:acyl-CoA dehydrogenase
VRVLVDDVLDDVRHADREGWDLFEALMDLLPRWAPVVDELGDVPEGWWRQVPIDVLNRVGVPVAWGGLPLMSTAVRRAVLLERLGHACPGLTLALPGPGLAMPTVALQGTTEQQRDFFGRFDAGVPRWSAFAITEPSSGSAATAMSTRARREGDEVVLDGGKCFITNGDRACCTVLFASLDPRRGPLGIRAFVVDAGTPGFTVTRTEDMMGMRASRLAELRLSEVRVPVSRMLGFGSRGAGQLNGFVGASRAWDHMRPGVSALVNGACAAALDRARRGLVEESGIPPARRDGIREQLTQWRLRVEASQLLALRAAWLYDRGSFGGAPASVAKSFSAQTAVELATWLAATLPVASATRGDPLEKFCRDARAFDILEGTGDMHRLIVARTFRAG